MIFLNKSKIRAFLEKMGQFFKGKNFRIDPEFPILLLFTISISRLSDLIRGAFKLNFSEFVFVGPGVKLKCLNKIKIGRGASIGSNVLINGFSINGVIIGNSVSIGSNSIIEASGSISEMGLGISIGDNTGIGSFCFIGGAGGVSIGNDVIMGQWVSFHPQNHNFNSLSLPIRLQGVNSKGISVGNDCWVGAKVTFLDGANVGEGCVIAAGSVVRGIIPAYSVIAGVPAKVIKSRSSDNK